MKRESLLRRLSHNNLARLFETRSSMHRSIRHQRHGAIRSSGVSQKYSTGLSLLIVLLAVAFHSLARGDELLTSAAASLTDALKEVVTAYEAKTRNKVNIAFGSSSALARQIEAGVPADLFFSADRDTMDALEKNARLEPGTRKDLLSNQLVVIVPGQSRLVIASAKSLLKPEVKRIALAEPSFVPVGVYSRKYLQSEGVWDEVRPKVIPVLDARATLASVESGNVDAGIVYRTDAAASKKVRVVFEVPAEKGPKIVYPVAVLKDSRQKATAREFLDFLTGPSAKSIFKKHGFIALE